MQMAQGSSYWKMIFTWSFDSGHAALAVEPPADRVRRGLGSLPKSPGGFPPPLRPVYRPLGRVVIVGS